MVESVKVWSTFSVTKESGTVKFKIVDVAPDRFNEFVDLFAKYFAKEESNFKAIGVAESALALEEYGNYMLYLLGSGDGIGTVCYVDNNDDKIGDFVGASITLVVKNGEGIENPVQPQSKELQKLVEVLKFMDNSYDPVKTYKPEKFLDDRGLVVHPDFRGKGIAQQLLKARRLMCRQLGIPMTGAWMTSYGTQKAGERDGWEVMYTIDKNEFGTKCGLTYDLSVSVSLLYMMAKI